MRSIGLTNGRSIEVISAYVATAQTIPSVTVSPGWFIIGSFFLPVSASGKLEVIGLTTDEDITLRVRVFDLTAAAPVSGTQVELASLLDKRAESGIVQLGGNRTYQFQAEAVGPAGFAVVKSAQLI